MSQESEIAEVIYYFNLRDKGEEQFRNFMGRYLNSEGDQLVAEQLGEKVSAVPKEYLQKIATQLKILIENYLAMNPEQREAEYKRIREIVEKRLPH